MHLRTCILLSSAAALACGATLFACGGSSTSSLISDGGANDGSTKDTTRPDDAGSDVNSKTDGEPQETGSNDAGDAATDAPYVESDADIMACTAEAVGSCALYEKCNPGGFPGAFGDGGNCITRSTNSCLADLAGLDVINPTHTAACAAALPSETCAQYLDNDNTLDACAPAGKLANGKACLTNGACRSNYCFIHADSACGVCADAPEAGAPCSAIVGCGFGQICYKGACVIPTTAVDGPCSATQSCGAGLSCVIAKDAGAGTCQTAVTTLGATCDPTLESGPGCSSEMGLTCVTDKSSASYAKCEAYGVASPGAACGSIAGVETQCQDVSECFPVDGGHQCIARAVDDAGCNTLTGPSCQAPSRCVGKFLDGGTSGTCVFPGSVECK